MKEGIIVGCDAAQQKLLAWWWVNYRLHNNLPVTFMDFGMNESGVEWCKKRGTVIKINPFKKEWDPKSKETLTKVFGYLPPNIREAWFKKPLALLQSPYEKTLWLDNDCIVRGDIASVFSYCDNETGMALCEEPANVIQNWRANKLIGKEDMIYNSGVIIVKRGSPLLMGWFEACHKISDYFRGDQEVLSYLINRIQNKPSVIPAEYNSLLVAANKPKKPVIVHYAGPSYKHFLENSIDTVQLELRQNFPF